MYVACLLPFQALLPSLSVYDSDYPPIGQSGPDIIVEVDIVMDEHATLRHTHDVSQVLQDKLETLPGVERAYVHVDYESTHTPVSGSVISLLRLLDADLVLRSTEKRSNTSRGVCTEQCCCCPIERSEP